MDAALTRDLQRAADLSEAGSHAQALALLERALATHPQHAPAHTARGWALENLGRTHLPQARAAYEAAIALDPNQLWARLGLATVLGQTGQAALCPPIYRDLIERAAKRCTLEPEYLELLGWCQYRLGQLVEACASFTRALDIDPHWVSARFDLALVQLLRGDARAAALHCEGALDTLARHRAHDGTLDDAKLGPVQVALDDLDDALAAQPLLAAAAAPLRARLLERLAPANSGVRRDECAGENSKRAGRDVRSLDCA